MMIRRIKFPLLTILLLSTYSCRDVAVPRPKGYFRIDLPQREYVTFDMNQEIRYDMPFTFEYPKYGEIKLQGENLNRQGWFNIEFPAYKAKIYLTYRNIKNDLDTLLEQTYKLNVKNHISKADAINEKVFNNKENKVYGVLYDLKGNTASAVQFYLTDSTKHYLRGSLYFAAEPDKDSLAPVIEFFRDDIIHLIETLKWTK
jgi:gliding motility-associated lipoprotein GldD